MYVIGIDGGGTKTAAAVADETGLLSRAVAGPSNYQVTGLDQAVSEIVTASLNALTGAQVPAERVAAVWAGLAGLNTAQDERTVLSALRSRLPGLIDGANDAFNCLATVTTGPGVAVIAGTGSIAVGVGPHGNKAKAGGWGYILGDEGSGYDVARQALNAVCRAADGRGPTTGIQARLLSHLKIHSVSDLYRRVYVDGLDRREIAALAAVVPEAARAGDEVAITLLHNAGRELGGIAAVVIERLGLGGFRFPVVLCGGLFSAGEPVIGPLWDTVRPVAPEAQITATRRDPVEGAVRLAFLLAAQQRGECQG